MDMGGLFDWNLIKNITQITDPAVEAILGHKSAASLATGPVI